MNTQPKIRIKKRGKVWDVECPHCFIPFGSIYIINSFTDAVAFTNVHLGTHFTIHRPYVIWSRTTGAPVARCHDCKWSTTISPFQAADRHLRESK